MRLIIRISKTIFLCVDEFEERNNDFLMNVSVAYIAIEMVTGPSICKLPALADRLTDVIVVVGLENNTRLREL